MIAKDDYETFGKVLIKLQFFETLIKLYVSLLNIDIKNNKKYGISELTANKVLNDTDKSKKTLGSLMFIIKIEIPAFNNVEFESFLEMRNIFIHSFYKEFLSAGAKKEDELTEYITTLFNLTNKYTDLFTGLLSLSVKHLSKGNISTEGINKNELDLIKYLLDNKK